MALIGVDFDADIATAVADLPGSMTWSGDAYACVISAIAKSERMDGQAGIFDEASYQIVVQTSLFAGSRPVAGDQVTVGGTAYRIIRVETDPPDDGLNIFVEELQA